MKPSLRKQLWLSPVIGLMLGITSTAFADETLSFANIWQKIQEQSKSLQASKLDVEAAKLGSDQASRHWLPRLYADIRAFGTNDPGAVFIGTLNQRAIDATDFAPSTLNEPGSKLFGKGTLGMQLSLYEGGAGIAQARSSEKMVESKKLEQNATLAQEYLESAKNYGQVSLIARRRTELQRLQELVEKTLAHYQIGTKTNPLGYSGLLGLKTLKNRMEGVSLGFDAKSAAASKRIEALAGGLPSGWSPEGTAKWDPFQFVDHYLKGTAASSSAAESSPRVGAAFAGAEAVRESVTTEKARTLPRVGLFALGDLNHGDRDTATSYSAGAFLSWDIFSPQSYGSGDRARAQAEAMEAKAQAAQRDESSMHESMKQNSQALKNGIKLMLDSQDLLAEQSQMARTLFLNGSINVLQMVEVYSRRLDLIESLTQAETNFLETRSAELATSGFVPQLNNGVRQ